MAAASILLSLIFFPAAADWAFIHRAFALAACSSLNRLTFIDRSPTASILRCIGAYVEDAVEMRIIETTRREVQREKADGWVRRAATNGRRDR